MQEVIGSSPLSSTFGTPESTVEIFISPVFPGVSAFFSRSLQILLVLDFAPVTTLTAQGSVGFGLSLSATIKQSFGDHFATSSRYEYCMAASFASGPSGAILASSVQTCPGRPASPLLKLQKLRADSSLPIYQQA
jgi:hypothetical protein